MNKKLNYFWPDYRFLISISGIVIIIDQLTKYLVRNYIPIRGTWKLLPWLRPYARIVHLANTGAAFGIFENASTYIAILAVIVAILIFIYFPEIPRNDVFLRWALAIQLGGALGNLIDRLTIGWVTDFISVGNFAVFNVADSCISIGIVLIMIPILRTLPKELEKSRLTKLAGEIHKAERRSSSIISKASEDEPMTLGILNVLLKDSQVFHDLIMKMRVSKLRYENYAERGANIFPKGAGVLKKGRVIKIGKE